MKRIFIAALAVVAVAACGKSDLPLENTKWKLVELEGERSSVFAGESDSFWFSLDGERIIGVGACNRFFGGYELSGDELDLGAMGMTKMYCPNIEWEDKFVRVLDEVDSYSIDGDVLTLFDDGDKLAEFVGSAMPSSTDGTSIDRD